MITTDILWQVKTCKPFNIVAYGRVFQENFESIVTGGEEGTVHVYEIPDKKAFKAKVRKYSIHASDMLASISQ